MTIIEYTNNNNQFELIVTGHAGYAEYGKDIVCSAMSMLVQTLYIYAGDEIVNAVMDAGDVYMRGERY